MFDGQPLVVPSDWRSDSTPALLLLEDLASSGWARGKPPLEHTLVSDKVFMVKDPVASKPYLQCLLGIPDWLGGGQLSALRSDQPLGYYRCLLASKRLDLVPVGAPSAGYAQLLASLRSADGQAEAVAKVSDEEASTGDDSSDQPIGFKPALRGPAPGKVRSHHPQRPRETEGMLSLIHI